MELSFGDESPWSGKASGFSFDPPVNQPWLYWEVQTSSSEAFLEELMQELFVVVRYDGKEIMRHNLRGSYLSVMKLLECQSSLGTHKGDPFNEDASVKGQDPFY